MMTLKNKNQSKDFSSKHVSFEPYFNGNYVGCCCFTQSYLTFSLSFLVIMQFETCDSGLITANLSAIETYR